jgi:dihydrofolate synthase/folylpolyglutamate synthase
MNYRQSLEYLYAQLPMFHRVGAAAYKADLGNTLNMCRLLGNPERDLRSIHIAGTNGKGSTSHLIAAALQSAGYKTGLYTSPHLKDFRERIKINGSKIPKSYVTAFVSRSRKIFETIQPSFFEYTAVMAFEYFKDEKVDIAVIETGMGGRLDSTNVIAPLLSVITNISFDHKAFLGDTLIKIATEKAGIIKSGIPVVIGETHPETKEVFLRRAAEVNAPITFADQNFNLVWIDNRRYAFRIKKRDGVPDDTLQYSVNEMFNIGLKRDGVPMTCPLKGIYQDKNLVTAFQALKVEGLGLKVEEKDIVEGFGNVVNLTGLQGRWQLLRRKPKVICDVGHNEAGIRYIIEQLKAEDFRLLHWVLGLVSDKDAESILELLPRDARYYFCKADIPRGLDAVELQAKARIFGLNGEVYSSVIEAYRAALNSAGNNDFVFVGGSTFVVAEVL